MRKIDRYGLIDHLTIPRHPIVFLDLNTGAVQVVFVLSAESPLYVSSKLFYLGRVGSIGYCSRHYAIRPLQLGKLSHSDKRSGVVISLLSGQGVILLRSARWVCRKREANGKLSSWRKV